MIENLLLTINYGYFVWSSFLITIFACLLFFIKTRKTLRKYEKDFACEIEKLSQEDKNLVLANSKIANQVLVSQNKTA
jgi:heme exporter protein D|tara:strand:+ start:305 stop:538 length:234 start_codon:yes stop_codon:yes gene_type:complete